MILEQFLDNSFYNKIIRIGNKKGVDYRTRPAFMTLEIQIYNNRW